MFSIPTYALVCVYVPTSLEADLGSHMDHFLWTYVQNETVEATMALSIIN